MPIELRKLMPSYGSKLQLVNIFLVSNAIIWYSSILTVLNDAVGFVGDKTWLEPSGQAIIWFLHFAGVVSSALIGAKISAKIKRTTLLLGWMTLTLVSSLTVSFLSYQSFVIMSILVVLYGFSFGLGMPACISNYSDSLPIENRGRISGLTMLVIGIGIFAFSAAPLDNIEMGVALSIWRALSLSVLLASRSFAVGDVRKRVNSFRQVLNQRSFLTYFAPWLLFSLVNFIVPLQPSGSSGIPATILLVQTIFLGISAVIGGFFLDFAGRKRVAISGFVMIGLAAAVRSVDSTAIVTMYFSAVFEGVAWGLLLCLYVLTIWGDLSDGSRSEKYYALGVTPFFISMLIGNSIGEWISNSLPSAALFSFAAFFLFIAILPLFYAVETLPEKITQKRQLENYVAKALQMTQQEDNSNKEKNAKSDEKSHDKISD
jgi:MFS family permease